MIEIRAHNLLCIQGFVGMGYSEKFVDNMSEIVKALRKNPKTKVKITISPDSICAACPHLSKTGCTLKGEGHESHMRTQDLDVLHRLQFKQNDEVKWHKITEQISKNIISSELKNICKGCPWLPSGLCATGIDRIKNECST